MTEYLTSSFLWSSGGFAVGVVTGYLIRAFHTRPRGTNDHT